MNTRRFKAAPIVGLLFVLAACMQQTAPQLETPTRPDPVPPPIVRTVSIQGDPASTDRDNYLVGGTIDVTSSSYIPGAQYDVPVIRPDGSIVHFDEEGAPTNGWDTVTADENGVLGYQYVHTELEGSYDLRIYDSPWSGDPAEPGLARTQFDVGDIVSERDDYSPGETVFITVLGFQVGGAVEFQVQHVTAPGPDGEYGTLDDEIGDNSGAGHEPWTVVDGSPEDTHPDPGTVGTTWFVDPDDSLGATFLLTASGLDPAGDSRVSSTSFTDAPAINHRQCQPGPNTGTNGITSNCITNSNPNGWKSGLNSGPFNQGESIPYRALMTDTVVGATYTLKIEYDVTKAGEHAIDYLTTFNRTMTNADACSDHGNAAICADVHTLPIPIDPQVTAGSDGIAGTADDITQVPGVFTLYGGTITSITYSGGTVTGSGTTGSPYVFAGTDKREITVVYTADLASTNKVGPVLTWSGHIARSAEWTNANPSGSPYHMRFNSWTCTSGGCSTGQQDLALNSAAVPTTDLSITKTDSPDPVTQGGTLTYTVTVTNHGPSIAANAIVTDTLPSGVTYVSSTASGGCTESPTDTLTCSLGNLAVGSVTSFDIVVTVDVTTIGTITNTARVGSDVLESNTANNTDTENTTVVVPSNPSLAIDKPAPINNDEDGSGDVSVGDTLTYTITATNDGDVNLTNVVVSDDLITTTGGTTPCTLVAPGGTCTLVGTYTVTAADVTAGQIDNTGTADSDQTLPVTDDETVLVPTPSLSVDKPAPTYSDADGSGDISAGDTLTYTITATNNGTANLTDVVVSDDLITPTGGTTPCALVSPGGTCTLIGTYLVTAADVIAGQIDNTATADSDQTGPDTDDETVFLPNPSLTIDKPAPTNADEDGSGDVSVGDTLTYTITATNNGTANLTNVVVSDSLITPTGGTTPCTLVAPSGTCTLIGTYVVTAADVAAGQIDNTATADSDQTGPVTDDETVLVPTPALSVDKPAPTNADEDGSGDVSEGDTLTYTVTATNSGTANLTDVVVSDNLITPTGGTTPCTLVTPGGICTLIGTYVVTAADVTAGQIDNTGAADSDQTDPVTDDETVLLPAPALSVDKPAPTNADEDGSGDVSVGDTLTYTITATNDGTANLTNVVVSDDLITPTGGTTPCTLVSPGGTCTLIGTYTVTPGDVAAGQIDNTATADSTQTDPVTDDETVFVPNPILSVDKPAPTNADEDGSGDVSVGDTLTYTITATNDGTANLTNVVITDTLITSTGGTNPCALVTPGGTCTLIGTYVVTAADVTAGQIDNTGTADSVQTDPVTDDETVPVPTPSLDVDKPAPTNADEDGSGDVSVGDTLTYTITATNDGTANLTNVVVTDDLITPTGGTTPCALVTPGGTCTLIGTYVVTAADIAVGQIYNTGTADSVQTDPVTDDETVPVPTPSLSTDKPAPTNADEDGSGDVSVGDTLTYTITATNNGTANLTNVVVSDDLITPTGGTTPCALVVPGGTCTLIGTYVVTADDVAAGQIVNTATADSVQTEPVTDDETVDVPTPSLRVDKPAPVNTDEDGSGDVSVGDTLTYTITATNNGTANLTNVVVSDPLITPTGGTTPCTLVAPGGTCTLIGTYVVTAADVAVGQIDNTATADSTQTEPVTDPETVSVPTPRMTVDKPAPVNADEDGSGDVSVGDTLTYTITATNDGTANLTDVVVTDPLITPTGGTTPCGLLVPGATCTLIGTYVVTPDDIEAGEIDNTATADSVQTEPITDDETVPVPTPNLSVDKPAPTNADEDGSGDVSAGDTLTYTVTATNSGTANLTDVVVSDSLITPTGGTTPCAFVAPGDTCTLIGTYVVTAADVEAGQIANTGTGDSVQTDPVTDEETVPVPTPSLSVDKPAPTNADEDGSGDVSAGDTLTYTITATNDGTANLTNVVVSDDLITPMGGTTPCASVAPTGTCTLIGTYVVTQADVDAGRIENLGTAESVQTPPATDPETVDVPQFPSIQIVKDFAGDEQESVVAGGAGSSFTLVVTNDGNVTLTNALIEDAIDPRLTVTGVSATSGADADSDADDQTVEWLIAQLDVGQSAIITVDFTVASSVAAATVDNDAAVAAEAPQGDPSDPADDVVDTDSDSIDVLVDFTLNIDKEFATVGAIKDSTGNTFTIDVFNSGPSDAVGVHVTDTVDALLLVTAVDPQPECAASSGQFVDCTFDIPAGSSVTVTVTFDVALLLPLSPTFGTTDGAEFRIVFVNGSVLEGSAPGPVYLDGVEIDAPGSGTKNDYYFDEGGFELHLSCSDAFIGGWGDKGGPDEFDHSNWQIAAFSIVRFKKGEVHKTCGEVAMPFDIHNTAFADTDTTDPVSDDASIELVDITSYIDPTLTLTKVADVTSAAAGDTITYTIEVDYDTGSGQRWAAGIVIDDNLCDTSPVYVGGDSDGDDRLDPNETWRYRCSYVVTGSEAPPVAVMPSIPSDGVAYEFVFYNSVSGAFLTVTGHAEKNTAFIEAIDSDVHVSCSDDFPGGIGENDGPDGDPWLVASYAIAKSKGSGCSDELMSLPNAVFNTAFATAYAHPFALEASATAIVTLE